MKNSYAFSLLFGISLLAFGMTLSLRAQASAPGLDANAGLLKMIQAGLPESTVLNKIREGAGHWDTSVDGLILLQQAGATAAELDALTSQPAALSAGVAPPPRPEIPAFGGTLGYTAAGVPYIQFPAGVLAPTLTGEPSNRIFLMRDGGRPLVVIPAILGWMNFDANGGWIMHRYLGGSVQGNILWSSTGVRFEDLCLLPALGGFVRNKGEKKKIWVDPGPAQDDFFAQKKQVAAVNAPLGFREIGAEYYLGTLKKDKIFGGLLIPGLAGFTWSGGEKGELPPAQYRSPELQEFIDKLIQQPEETIAEFAKAAKLSADASSWSTSLDYIYNTKESARHYASVNTNFVAELKAKQPVSASGFGALVNVMQGVSNMQTAMQDAKTADLTHNTAGQLRAATNATTAEMQTLGAVSGDATVVQPLAPTPSTQAQPTAAQMKPTAVAAPQKTTGFTYNVSHGQTPSSSATANNITSNTQPKANPNPGGKPSGADTGTAAPATCVYLSPSQPCVPVAQYQQMQAQQRSSDQGICPASGFVPSVMMHPTSDVAVGVPCKPGTPYGPLIVTTASGGYTGVTPPGPAPSGGLAGSSSGSADAGGPSDPDLRDCIAPTYKNDPITGSHLILTNNCSVRASVYFFASSQAHGSVDLNPGEADNTYAAQNEIAAAGGVSIYACPVGDIPRQADGTLAYNGANNHFRCSRQ
jgi:hypothetical protein